MNLEAIPVIVGVGQVTVKNEALETCSSPSDLTIQSARLAAEDAGAGEALLRNLDRVVVVRSFQEEMRNSPQHLADSLGAESADCYLTPHGGNLPQYLVNSHFEAIAQGKMQAVLIGGAEALDNKLRCQKAGVEPAWSVDQKTDCKLLIEDKRFATREEVKHGLAVPAHCYPLFENGLRHHLGESIADHQLRMGRLFAPFTQVASRCPTAWYPKARTAEEIAQATATNRYVGWPYTKYMNAMNNINQGAAIIMTSVGYAKSLGIPESKWVYLHGCADANEITNVSERQNYYTSPAMQKIGEVAFAQAGFGIDAIDFIDIYSCFPVAVQMACRAFSLAEDDPRGLTVTGGLPYHGGAGNNYVMNSIATMMDILRAHPGKKGMVTANGGYLSKHSVGLYSTEPPLLEGGRSADVPWLRRSIAEYQAEIDAKPHPKLAEQARGEAKIETYTVLYDRDNKPASGIVIGRLADGRRCCAKAPDSQTLLEEWTQEEGVIGLSGQIQASSQDGVNMFMPA